MTSPCTTSPGEAQSPSLNSSAVAASVGGESGSADDAGGVLQLGRDDGRAQRQQRKELLRLARDPAADDEQVRPEEVLQVGVVALLDRPRVFRTASN